MTKTLPEFLLARIAEDEAYARNALAEVQNAAHGRPSAGAYLRIPPEWVTGVANRQLAECDAKRRIVESWQEANRIYGGDVGAYMDRVLRDLAAVYADHPDHQDDWRH